MNLISTLISIAARLVLAAASIVLFLAVLAAGLVIFGVLMLWSLIRGRKPTLNNAAFQRAAQFRAQGFRTGPGMGQRPAPQGDIIDAEVREVPNTDPRLER